MRYIAYFIGKNDHVYAMNLMKEFNKEIFIQFE